MQIHRLRLPLINKPFSLPSPAAHHSRPAENKRRAGRSGQPLIKFPPLFLPVPFHVVLLPVLVSGLLWFTGKTNMVSGEAQEHYSLSASFSSYCLNRSCLEKSYISLWSDDRWTACFPPFLEQFLWSIILVIDWIIIFSYVLLSTASYEFTEDVISLWSSSTDLSFSF